MQVICTSSFRITPSTYKTIVTQIDIVDNDKPKVSMNQFNLFIYNINSLLQQKSVAR